MQIPKKTWDKYIKQLSSLNYAAGALIKDYVETNGIENKKALTDYAYYVVQKYGNGSAALSAAMYDTLAALEGANVAPAVMADLPEYDEVAKTVYGTLKSSKNPDELASATSRLVKRAGADTTLKNAKRDGAQFAWVPAGDTCAFCLALASNGWQYMSKEAMKGGHAEHIHANCDCTYAVRFDNETTVAGYDPQKYKDIYDDAEGKSSKDKVNAIRRMQYNENKDKINAQKREAYALRKETNKLIQSDSRGILNVRTSERNSEPLSKETINECFSYATSLGMPEERIKYSDNYYTSYSPMFDILLIGTDVLPNPDAKTINGQLSMRSAIAHEVVGHREAGLRGLSKFSKDDPRDEAQASIRAARFAPGLTQEDRNMLIMDALTRLKNGGYKLKDIKATLDINER